MVLMKYIFQTTTTLLAALSASAKTDILWNSWTPFFKFLKVNLGLGGKDLNYCNKMKFTITYLKIYINFPQ